jgi:hypothetical protein
MHNVRILWVQVAKYIYYSESGSSCSCYCGMGSNCLIHSKISRFNFEKHAGAVGVWAGIIGFTISNWHSLKQNFIWCTYIITYVLMSTSSCKYMYYSGSGNPCSWQLLTSPIVGRAGGCYWGMGGNCWIHSKNQDLTQKSRRVLLGYGRELLDLQ